MATDIEQVKSFIAVAHNGGNFHSYAADGILGCIQLSPNLERSVCYYLLMSALNRGDDKTCMAFATDWNLPTKKPTTTISRFLPGSHWHVLGTKFLSYAEALKHLESEGYRCVGVDTKRVSIEGD